MCAINTTIAPFQSVEHRPPTCSWWSVALVMVQAASDAVRGLSHDLPQIADQARHSGLGHLINNGSGSLDALGFDVVGYEHAVRLWTIVLEISVLMAQFPSKQIALLSYRERQVAFELRLDVGPHLDGPDVGHVRGSVEEENSVHQLFRMNHFFMLLNVQISSTGKK